MSAPSATTTDPAFSNGYFIKDFKGVISDQLEKCFQT